MIPQVNQIPVWITNRCEQSYMTGTNFRSASNIASHSRASVKNINNNRSLPSVMLVNARSLFNKINELEILVEMQEIDIVCVTETWLKDKMPGEAIGCLGIYADTIERTEQVGELRYLLIIAFLSRFVRS